MIYVNVAGMKIPLDLAKIIKENGTPENYTLLATIIENAMRSDEQLREYISNMVIEKLDKKEKIKIKIEEKLEA